MLHILEVSDIKECEFVYHSLFYADIFHLHRFCRPITGDIYVKTSFDVVPSVANDIIYEHNAFETKEVLYNLKSLCVIAKRKPDMRYLSETDIKCLDASIKFCKMFSIAAIADNIRKSKAWEYAEIGFPINYLDLIDQNNENAKEIMDYIKETSETLVL